MYNVLVAARRGLILGAARRVVANTLSFSTSPEDMQTGENWGGDPSAVAIGGLCGQTASLCST